MKLTLAIFLLASSLLHAAEPNLNWRAIEKDWRTWINTPVPALKQKALTGDPIAKYFYYAKTVEDQPEDKERWALAEKYLVESSEAGVPHAIYQHAGDYRDDQPSKYIELLGNASQTGFPLAQLDLAREHLEGRRAPVDEAKAVELTRQAADAGYRAAQFELAEMYATGMGEPRHDGETPFKLYLLAANQGYEEAFLPLAKRSLLGFGTDRDIMEAARWYWRAKQHRIPPYEDILDAKYPTLPHDDPAMIAFKEFYSLYEKTQLRRDPADMLKVGQAFLEGRHSKPNPKTAYYWLSAAQKSGNQTAAPLFQKAKEHLTPDQITTIEKELQNP